MYIYIYTYMYVYRYVWYDAFTCDLAHILA